MDLRPRLEGWGLEARHQGKRNTCSVFVVTEALEYALAAKEGRGRCLSVEYLNWAANQALHGAEDGGFFSDLWKGFEARRICLEEDMPYRQRFEPSNGPSENAQAGAKTLGPILKTLRFHWIKEWDPKKGLSKGQLAEVRRTLERGWPVCGGFLWPKQEAWDDGILRSVPREDVRDGHSVLLVGYRDDPGQPGGGVFMIRNTAGPGRDGFLTYEYLLTYMNDAAWIDSGADAPPKCPPAPEQPGASRALKTQ